MAVVDHVVVGDVFAIAGRLVFDLGCKTQAAVHPVIKFHPVGLDAVVFGVTVTVIDTGRVCAGIKRPAEGADSNEIAE
ncbi:hypothetical protein D9M71_617250 [compost metagenome]